MRFRGRQARSQQARAGLSPGSLPLLLDTGRTCGLVAVTAPEATLPVAAAVAFMFAAFQLNDAAAGGRRRSEQDAEDIVI